MSGTELTEVIETSLLSYEDKVLLRRGIISELLPLFGGDNIDGMIVAATKLCEYIENG